MEANYEKEIRNLPDQIKDTEVELVSINKQILENELILKSTEETILEAISQESTEEGKKKFTNDAQRKYELFKRLSNEKLSTDMKIETIKLKEKAKLLEINLGFLKRTFRMHELFSRVGL